MLCSICHDPLRKRKNTLYCKTSLKQCQYCNNQFHSQCLEKMIAFRYQDDSIQCPLCRENLLIDELFPEGYLISTNLKENISFLCKKISNESWKENKIKLLLKMFECINTKEGKEYLIKNTKFKKVVQMKLLEFYHYGKIFKFYQIYRDLFNERMPFQHLN